MSRNNSLLRLTYVIDTNAIGGTEKYLFDLATSLRQQYVITLICPEKKVLDQWVEKFIGNNIIVVRMHIHHIFDIKNMLHLLWLLLKTNIVHFVLPCPANNRIAMGLARIARVPLRLATLQLVVAPNSRLKWRNLYTTLSIRVAYSFVHRIIAVSEENKRQLQLIYKIDASKISIIYNAITLQPQKAIQISDLIPNFVDNHSYIGVIGRLHPQKGHAFLIHAAPQIVAAFPRCHFLFVGDGEEQHNLEQLITEKGLERYFTFTGALNQVEDMLPYIYMLALPSLFEGFPFVILEAMAASKPVVAFNSGGISEAVDDGITGLLISPQNIDDLAEAIIFLLNNKAIAIKMGQMGRRRVTKMFDLKMMVEKTNSVYRSF